MIQSMAARSITFFFIVTTWLSFLASMWLSAFEDDAFFWFALVWLWITIFLAAMLAGKPKR